MAAKRIVITDDGPFGAEYFEWRRCSAGYQWERRQWRELGRAGDEVREGRVLLAKADELLPTRPLREPLLFRRLAECSTTANAYQAFADQHGLLGIPVQLAENNGVFIPWGDVGALDKPWSYHGPQIRGTVTVINALKACKTTELSRWVMTDGEVWNDKLRGRPGAPDCVHDAWYFAGQSDQGLWTDFIGLDTRNLSDSRPISRTTAARLLLVQVVNRYLSDHCVPYLEPRPQRADLCTVRMRPKTLLGACWWQFARLLAGQSGLRLCKECGRGIELSRDDTGSRIDREFCSPKCKAKGHRARIRSAKQLKAQGKTVKQIAKALGTTTERVEYWLIKKK